MLKRVIAFAACVQSVVGVTFNESRTWEVMLPCRDGVKLHTRIVMPKGDDGSDKLQLYINQLVVIHNFIIRIKVYHYY
jgi:hypothetical protein